MIGVRAGNESIRRCSECPARSRLFAAENVQVAYDSMFHAEASMRPRLFAAENDATNA